MVMTNSARWSLIVTFIALAIALPQYFTVYRSAPPHPDRNGHDLPPNDLILALHVVTQADAKRDDTVARYEGVYAPTAGRVECRRCLDYSSLAH
jgi:hypothetical protein